MIRVIQHVSLLDRLAESEIYVFPPGCLPTTQRCFLFHKLFFHKVFGVQRRGEKLTRSF